MERDSKKYRGWNQEERNTSVTTTAVEQVFQTVNTKTYSHQECDTFTWQEATCSNSLETKQYIYMKYILWNKVETPIKINHISFFREDLTEEGVQWLLSFKLKFIFILIHSRLLIKPSQNSTNTNQNRNFEILCIIA